MLLELVQVPQKSVKIFFNVFRCASVTHLDALLSDYWNINQQNNWSTIKYQGIYYNKVNN